MSYHPTQVDASSRARPHGRKAAAARARGRARLRPGPVDLFDSTSANFTDRVLDEIRKETFGVDIGQHSWLTAQEYERLLPWLALTVDDHVLEVASGSGGPALYVARELGCRVRGLDESAACIATANALAARAREGQRVSFEVADANAELPFANDAFDALLCIDSMNHFPDRLAVLREWQRVLRPDRRALFTDPVVLTGPVTNEELAQRSSIGSFLFVPPGVNERLIEQASFRLVRREDLTAGAALVSGRWHDARAKRRDALLRIEGEARYEGLQRFFYTVHRLTSERRLSRIAYVVEKRAR